MTNEPDQDLYALPPDAIKEPPHTLCEAIRQIGPGLILAASIVGTGELINTTSLGAKAGFSLLWLILLSCVIKVFVQVELGRYAITHGKTTLAAFDSLPGPRLGVSWLCWLWLFMMLTTQAQIAAMEGTVGQAAHMAFPRASRPIADVRRAFLASWRPYLSSHQEHFWAALTTLAAVLLLLSGGYRRLEKITTVLVAAVTLFTVASVLILQWTRFRDHAARSRARVRAGRSAGRGRPGLLGVRDHRRRRVRALRLSVLVHREGLRALHRRAKPRTMPGPAAPEAGPASCSSTPGSAWSSSRSRRSPSTSSARPCSIPRTSTPRARR